jgi:hypothetical protein
MLITGLTHTWFFVAGILFNDFLRSAKQGWVPFILTFGMAIFWPVFLVWWIINYWSYTTTGWYTTFAKKVFIEK